MNSGHWKITAWLCAMLLAGCGGSSGGGSSTPPPAGGGDPAAIDQTNAPMIAGGVIEAALDGGVFGSLLSQGPIPTASVNDMPAAVSSKLQQAAQAVVQKVPIGPETTDCQVDGTITVSGEIANPLTLSAGDNFSLVFDMCDDGDGTMVNGSFTMTVFSLQGDLASEQFVLVLDMSINGFEVMEGGEMASGNGDIRLSLDTMTPPATVVTSSGNSVVLSAGGLTQTMRNFSISVSEDGSMFPASVTLQVSGAITSSAFEGEVTFSTPVAFQAMGEENPFVGELLITGAEGATIRVIAMDSVNVRLEIDTPDAFVTIDTTWDALDDSA